MLIKPEANGADLFRFEHRFVSMTERRSKV
jgi:hypothetical protein